MSLESHDINLEHLFFAALGVLNRALDAHRGSMPYRQMLAECRERLQNRRDLFRRLVLPPDRLTDADAAATIPVEMGCRRHWGSSSPS